MAISFIHLFLDSFVAVAELFAMAAVGIICTRKGLVNQDSRKFLSEMSFKVTIPCLLFANIIKCPTHVQKAGECESLAHMLQYAWPFFFLPFIWVALGAIVGCIAVCAAGTPTTIRGTAMAACTFGNSTAVPIVLLTALSSMRFGMHGTHGSSMRLRLYLAYLSIYLTTYQILLWSIGNWLLTRSATASGTPLASFTISDNPSFNPMAGTSDLAGTLTLSSPSSKGPTFDLPLVNEEAVEEPIVGDVAAQQTSCCRFANKLAGWARNFFVPPVIAIFLGLFVGSFDGLRGTLVHMPHHGTNALGCFFKAIQKFGGAAVPMVMLVLGSSLANGFDRKAVHWPTTLAVTIGRLIVMPGIAYTAVYVTLAWTTGPLFFGSQIHFESAVVVGLIATCSPTANNIVVMAELWGGAPTKQALSAMIFVQYCLAPFSLTCWVLAIMSMLERAAAR